MAVTYVTLYPPGGNSTTVQVVEGSQLHLIYADMGFSATPSAPGPPKRPDPFPQYVHDDEVAALVADAAVPATDPVVAALLGDGGSQTRVALDALDLGGDPITPEAVEANLPARLSEAELRAAFVAPWKANTAYPQGQLVMSPTGEPVTALTAFTSGASYNPANWSAPIAQSRWTFITVPEVHVAGSETPVYARTVGDGKVVGNWNAIHDGSAGDIFHFTTGPNTSTRTVTDLATTSGSAVITSATAAFTTGHAVVGAGTDVGKTVTGTGIPAGANIVSVQSATQATISANATATATGVSAVIGTGNPNGAVLAIGIDDGATGIVLVNKWRGVGLNIRQRESVASSSSFALQLTQESGVAAAAAFRMNAGVTGAKAAVARFDVFGGTAPADTPLVEWLANTVGGSALAGRVMADTGVLAWSRTVQAVAASSSVTPQLRVADEVATYPTEAFLKAKTTADAGLTIYRNTTGAGGNDQAFGGRVVMDTAAGDRLVLQAGSGAAVRGSHTWRTLISLRGATGTTGGIGFFGATPVARPAAITAPTGGTTVDTEARAAIASLLTALGATSGLGLLA